MASTGTAFRTAFLTVLLVAAGCEGPPPDAYVAGGSRTERASGGQPIGRNRLKESCTLQDGAANEKLVYCGQWEQPSARLRDAADMAGLPLRTLATSGAWRQALDARFVCGEPAATTILTGEAALLLNCTQRIGGWPHMALVAIAGGRAWLTDGVDAAEPVIERVIAAQTGRAVAVEAAEAGAETKAALQLASQPVRADDIQRYDAFMKAASNANRAGDWVAAELAYRHALEAQELNLGRDNPALADTLLSVALQVSNQGRFPEAEALFARAAPLVVRQEAQDRSLKARAIYYRALHTENLSDDALAAADRAEDAPTKTAARTRAETLRAQAAAMLAQADMEFASALPAAQVTQGRAKERAGRSVMPELRQAANVNDQNGVIGQVETRRYEAILLRQMGRDAEAATVLASARTLAEANDIRGLDVRARLIRVSAASDAAQSRPADAAADFGTAASTFAAAKRDFPQAETALAAAGQLVVAGRTAAALSACRTATALLRDLRQGETPDLIVPCLTAWAAEAASHPADAQLLLREMFEAAQLAQSGTTSRQIATMAARLSEGAKDPNVGKAIRAREDVANQIDKLSRERGRLAAAGGDAAALADIDRKLAEQQEARASADLALQGASPGYNQLVQYVTPAGDVFAALRPGELFVSIVDAPEMGWLMALRDGRIAVAPVAGGERRMAALVRRVRDSVTPGTSGVPPFDVAAARELYDATFAQVADTLNGADRLVVAPTGALLSVPFEVMVGGPDIGGKPAYLVRRVAIAHVPAPASFVSLRHLTPSTASNPWIGFGDFRPPSLAQARITFPAGRCGDAADVLAHAPPLPGSRTELDNALKVLDARATDEVLGDNFTAARVLGRDLTGYRIVHFSAHGIFANEIACLAEPAIMTSTPGAAKDAGGTMLTASKVLEMKMNADAVLLSACDTGVAVEGGESLTSLARTFFFAGARALMVTHWELNDAIAPQLIGETLRQYRADPRLGIAGALRSVQVEILDKSASGAIPADYGHPFLWAPFVVIGDGGGAVATVRAGL